MLKPRLMARRVILTLATALVALCTPGVAHSALRHGIIYYVPAPNNARRDIVAQRYAFGVTNPNYGTDAAYIKQKNPNFEWYVYNSGSDNYVPSGEDDKVTAIAAAHGWDPEDAYMHFYNDTNVNFNGTTVFVPGWGGGSATTKKQARVPVYYADLSRRLVNTTNPRGAQIHKELLASDLLRQFSGTTLYPDGLFLDNSAHQLWNTGTIPSGQGQVLEHPTRAIIGSPSFQDWYWNQGYGPFLGALKDTLSAGASWHPDGKAKKLMINNSNSWSDSYVGYDVADALLMEFQYSPVRNQGQGAVSAAFDRAQSAHAAGIESFFPSLVVTSVSGYSGSYTYEEGIRSNLAFYLAARAPSTSLFVIGTFDVSASNWESQVWAGCIDVANSQLGEVTGPAYTLQSGTDGRGYPYTVTARPYSNGLAIVRARGDWNQHIDASTAATINLPSAMRLVAPNGTLGAPVTQISLRNGEGLFFVGDGGEEPPPPVETLPQIDLGEAFQLLSTSPPNASSDVAPGAAVRFLMSAPVNASTANSSTVTVSGSSSGTKTGTVTVEGGGRLIVFRPATPFSVGETVTANLAPGVRSVDGALLDGNADGSGSNTSADAIVISFTIVSSN